MSIAAPTAMIVSFVFGSKKNKDKPMFKDFDFSPGKAFINNDISWEEQLDNENLNLTEDLVQVEYPQEIVVDIGWYSGIMSFLVYVIKDYNWEKPLLKLESKTIQELSENINKAKKYIESILDKKTIHG